MKILALSILALLGASQAMAEAPASPCALISGALSVSYKNLYNLDTRPLSIDAYTAFRDNIETIRLQTDALNGFCATHTAPTPTEQSIYKNQDLAWAGSWGTENTCPTANFGTVKSEFQETALRLCYRDGFRSCTVKTPARVYYVTGTRNTDGTWKCTAQMDVVLSAVK
jgi:hypothetical protein